MLSRDKMKRKRWLVCFMGILLISACRSKDRSTSQTGLPSNTAKEGAAFEFDLQGHRGARGLAPENSLPAFKKALELGVNTLELDVVVTKTNSCWYPMNPG